jgi:ArsR family transcriptional regulator, arsenate/arsenite/antimonite-responsive transcriptional repressor
MNKKTEEQAAFFKVLSDPTRLELVKLLSRQPKSSTLCVNALAYHLGITQSAVSQHLRVLKSMGLVEGERRGYRVHYFINPAAIKRGRNFIASTLEIEEP